MTLLSVLCLRRILPLLVQIYFQLNFFLSSVAKENKCLFLFVRFCNDLENFINKTALINLENQYAAIKTTR